MARILVNIQSQIGWFTKNLSDENQFPTFNTKTTLDVSLKEHITNQYGAGFNNKVKEFEKLHIKLAHVL